MSAADLIKSTLDYAALAYAPPPFALVKGEVRRTEGYVVVMRFAALAEFRFCVTADCARRPRKQPMPTCTAALRPVLLSPARTELLDVTSKRRVLSRDTAEALFANVCADLRSEGASMRQWCETLPFQVILAKTTRTLARKHPPEYTPVLYASGPRWIPTKERPADDTP